MKILKLKAVDPTEKILKDLESRSLIRGLYPPKALLNSRAVNGTVETIYTSKAKFGTHKLICVKLNSSRVELNSHQDNEEFIIINSGGFKFNPVYLLIGLDKHGALEKKAVKGILNENDFVLLKMRYNDPRSCVFTMLKDTVHCELTLKKNPSPAIFFVSEPSRLKMRFLKSKGYSFKVQAGVD